MGGKFRGEWVHVYIWLSSFAVHLKPSQHCYLAILQLKKKKKNKYQAVDLGTLAIQVTQVAHYELGAI